MPKIDARNFQELLEERKSVASLYAPEWNVGDEKGVGVVLLKIFTHMQEEIISRLNRVPEKNFTAFLDMLGIKLMPAQPAKVPVTFYLAEGIPGGVLVPARTQVATAETEAHEALTFETKNNFSATSATLEEIYSIDPGRDVILSHLDDLKAKREFKIFDEDKKNLQEHVLYLGHGDLFSLKEQAKIKLKFEFVSGSVKDLANLSWEYWGEDEKIPEKFIVSTEENLIVLTSKGEIKEKEIKGITSHWIHCRLNRITDKSILPVISKIQIRDVAPEKSIKPDLGFYNSIPLDLTTEFYPFSTQPRLFDTFYIASKEVFSKKKAKIKVTFKREAEKPDSKPTDVMLSWEYWNGTLWQPLKIKENRINNFILEKKENGHSEGYIEFYCPEDFEVAEVNGQGNYWIRVHLIKGDYGKEEFTKKPKQNEESKQGEVWVVKPNFKPPLISDIGIEYSLEKEIDPQHCLAYNNLEYRDFTKESKGNAGFKPFIPLTEKHPTFYLGFKGALKKGNTSIFFSLVEKIYPVDARPEIKWTYWSEAPKLSEDMKNAKDVNLISMEGIGIGTELLFEESFDAETMTETAGVESHSDNEITLDRKLDCKYTKTARIFKRTYLEVSDNTEYLTTSGTLEFIGPSEQIKTRKFGKECYWLMGTVIKDLAEVFEQPLIRGIYPNTVWAEQVETIRDEILGSSDGEKRKSYKFIKSPVISPEIWVREKISKDEKEALSKEEIQIQEIKEESGKVMETWIRWKAVEDFFDSGPRSRHCIIDRALGEARFGDGINGMIPPVGRDNIKTNYKSGGGVKGNVAKDEINILRTPVTSVDRVINHEPAEGGADTELLEAVFERGPHLIKHRDRAVTEEDFERLARAVSSSIARTRCFTKGDKLKIIIIPKGEEDKPMPSAGLMKMVEKHLRERSLNLILPKSIEVREPSYKEVKVTVDVVPESIDQAIPLEKEILKRLKEFFHPLTGGHEKRGWEFGRDVHISDVYALLEGIKGVEHVEKLKLNGKSEDVKVKEFRPVCSGEHRIRMKLGG